MARDTEVWQKAKLFANLWEKEYGEVFIVNGQQLRWAAELKDIPNDMVIARARVYFQNEFYGNCRHSLAAFAKNFNSFIPPKKEEKKIDDRRVCKSCGTILDYAGQLCSTCHPPAAPEVAKRYLDEITNIMGKIGGG